MAFRCYAMPLFWSRCLLPMTNRVATWWYVRCACRCWNQARVSSAVGSGMAVGYSSFTNVYVKSRWGLFFWVSLDLFSCCSVRVWLILTVHHLLQFLQHLNWIWERWTALPLLSVGRTTRRTNGQFRGTNYLTENKVMFYRVPSYFLNHQINTFLEI